MTHLAIADQTEGRWLLLGHHHLCKQAPEQQQVSLTGTRMGDLWLNAEEEAGSGQGQQLAWRWEQRAAARPVPWQ